MSSIPKSWRDRNLLNFAVVLRSGGDYIEEDPIILSRQVMRHLQIPHRFICLTDFELEDPYVDFFKLEKNWPGWWSVIELFRITGPTIVTGLDTIIVDNINRLGEMALTCPETDFYMTGPQPAAKRRGEKFCSGIMMWNGDWSWLYRQFDPVYIKKFGGEERYTTWQLLRNQVNVRTLQEEFDGFYSYKNDCRGKKMPSDAKVIAFHGKPRPRECEEKWAQEILKDYSLVPHSFAQIFEKANRDRI